VSRRRRLRFQNRVLLLTLVTAAPAWVAAAALLWNWNTSAALRWTLFMLISVFVAGGLLAVRRRVVTPLQEQHPVLGQRREGGDAAQGLQLDPSCYGCLYHLGVVKFVAGEFAGAADAFARGLPLAPNAGERAGSIDWSWMSLMRAGQAAEAQAVLDRNADSLPVENAYTRRLRLYRGQIGPEQVLTPTEADDVNIATLSFGLGNWYLVRGDTARAREWFGRAVASGGWPAFGFIAAEAELTRMR